MRVSISGQEAASSASSEHTSCIDIDHFHEMVEQNTASIFPQEIASSTTSEHLGRQDTLAQHESKSDDEIKPSDDKDYHDEYRTFMRNMMTRRSK
jgi:hypothetical protein